jgi:hypothetical protein
MRTRASLVSSISLLFLVGCASSVHPVSLGPDLLFKKYPPVVAYPTTTTVPVTTVPVATTTVPKPVRATTTTTTRPAAVHASSSGYTGKWACIAYYESTDRPGIIDPPYYSGLQFTLQTWGSFGGVGNPAYAPISEQESVADRVLAAQGWGAWPVSSRRCGYR